VGPTERCFSVRSGAEASMPSIIPWKESYVRLRQWATWALVFVVFSTAVPAERAWAQCPIFSNQWQVPNTEWAGQLVVHALAVDGAGNVYVGDMVNGRIVKFTSDGTVLAQWGSFGAGDGQFSDLYGVGIA